MRRPFCTCKPSVSLPASCKLAGNDAARCCSRSSPGSPVRQASLSALVHRACLSLSLVSRSIQGSNPDRRKNARKSPALPSSGVVRCQPLEFTEMMGL